MATPLCPYFGKCGGCSTQHIDYELQLKNKSKQLEGAIHFLDLKVFSGKPYFYRNRMDFIFHKNGLGLRRKGTWDVLVNVEKCVIANERINHLLQEVRLFFCNVDYFDLCKHTGTFRYAVVRDSHKTSLTFILNADSSNLQEADSIIREFAEKSSADIIIVARVPPEVDESVSNDFYVVKGEDSLQQEYLGKIFSYSTQGFFQNNQVVAEKMQQYVHGLLENYQTSPAVLLDLYGGVGTFGIINADLFKEVIIVEEYAASVESARQNILINNLKNTKAITLDAKQLSKLTLQKLLFVITDPPRKGMDPKTIEQLKRLNPEVIIYISCNVQQLSKDIIKFKNYLVKSVALFDLFPQTNHGEVVVELIKK